MSTELLRCEQSIRFRAPGRSMYPTIKEEETITVVPVGLTPSSKLSVHHLFLLRGDASSTCDEPVEAQQVLGKVTSVRRDGRSIDLCSRRAKMLLIAHAWLYRLKRYFLSRLG